MSDFTLSAPATETGDHARPATVQPQATCEECVGSGGWFRYEPSLDPAPGLLYLSCLQCRGSGRTAQPRA
ncbi:hypothetical protein [Ramlibacter pallidus]|uniref:Uncharacterized protein n=1 Tax=Ramlibacter pallidus TaxID=2780087 RepID=A0ABR9RZZ2_9BURK|nr:hypothetical protein [Ramlibacter pallidus]MBE7366820.1 hypothetical protein [Ramlibacter pallidus]